MDTNIFHDFENNMEHTAELLDGIASSVSLFMLSDELKFLHFNRAADEMFGYEKGGLYALTQKDPVSIFHPSYVDGLYSEIIATMRNGKLFHFDCRILCRDGSYKWTNLSAELVQQKEGGRLYFYCVLSPIEAPRHSLLEGRHFLVAAGDDWDRHTITDLIEGMGGTCHTAGSGLEALDLFIASQEDPYHSVFIGSRLTGMNGFELSKEIRHSDHPDGSKVPLILLISEDDHETMVHAAEEIGINLFLQKPLEKKAIRTLLTQLSQSST
ncbi:PAS domain-containing protein [Anaerovorax odorimutans]|uniref:Stage 0 sporulation protein A homolog n=1 Tax=Anaerovorax odorimutans TaxID=109327 RepID=A0ABT1RK17_9FIRM|nr:PAS domain-containing protein [Anaerovorax odorimutans]MCQ4635514.1 PAS domain-containing protein [Anaerovorax odorimutans]